MIKYKLGELIEIGNGTRYSHLEAGNIPLYGSGGIMSFVNDYLYDGEAILLPRKGTLTNIMYTEGKIWTVDTMYYAKVNKLANSYYLYSYLSLLDLSHLDSGSALPSMTQWSYNNLEVLLPPLKIQNEIAIILKSLDAKIELNNKINRELEAMAKTLYDYWFVQFDFPISATYAASIGKPELEGKTYKSSGGKMVYNEELNREIPKGWSLKDLSEIESNIVTGKTPPTKVKENFGGEIPFITINDIRQDTFIVKSDRTLSELGAHTQKNKFIYENDICVSCIGTVGVIGFAGRSAHTNQQINTISQAKDYNRYYLFHYLQDYFAYNVAAKKGAVLSNMNKGEFESIRVIDPETNLKQEYFENVNSMFKTVLNNIKQSQELAELRDWLLPMLMNGQVTVGDAYAAKEEVLGMVAEDGVKYGG